MRTLMMSLAVATSLMACSGGEEPAATAPEAASTAEAAPAPEAAPEAAPEPAEVVAAFDAKGEFEKTCAACHGTSGLGDGVAAAALNPKPASFAEAVFWETRTPESLHAVIKSGGAANGKSPLMAPYGGMYDDEQITLLVSYISDTWKPAS